MDEGKAEVNNLVSSESKNEGDCDMIGKHSKVEFIQPPQNVFKKPDSIIISSRGKNDVRTSSAGAEHTFRSKSSSKSSLSLLNAEKEQKIDSTSNNSVDEKILLSTEKQTLSVPYKEPIWGGKPSKEYGVEVLKSGVILETINLSTQSFYVIGRLPICDIRLAHPTISRYHAILQHRKNGDEKNGPGLYLYDLGSTHKTFINGRVVNPKTYVKLRGGYMVKFGCSQRKFIIQTPDDDYEGEELVHSISEWKEMRRVELQNRIGQDRLCMESEEGLEDNKDIEKEDDGISWGMGEDADPESDPTENPFASTNNEEIFLDDPKKTLRGWFERTGNDLKYETEEKGVGRFLCWVDLPISNSTSRTVRAEALVKGKKKEAVIQCAFEACRILDRHGVLRQQNYEGRKRKTRNWEADDFYDSDEDNFLDRTGTVERKREQRMKNAGKLETKVETYASLMEKYSEINKKIMETEATLENHEKTNDANVNNSNEDALDAFMSKLTTSLLDKSDVKKLKLLLQNLRVEKKNLEKIIDIAKPVSMPTVDAENSTQLKKKVKNEVDEIRETHSKSHQISEDSLENSSNQQERSGFGLITHTEHLKAKEIEDESMIDSEKCGSEDEQNVKSKEAEKIEVSDPELPKKRKKNQRVRQHKTGKASIENSKKYEEETYNEDYSTWLPPENQSGDGKTSLNDKFGY